MTHTITFSEVFDIIKDNPQQTEYFFNNQESLIELINTALNDDSKPEQTGTFSFEANCIIGKCRRKIEADALELENTVKYSGVKPHIADKIEVGAILVSSWGYDQTNVDFYVVVSMTAKMCVLLPMDKRYIETGFMSGISSAQKTISFRNEPLRKKINNKYVRICSYSSASLWDGRKRYESHYA